MTNGRAIIVAMSLNLGISADQIEKASVDFGLDSTEDYTIDAQQQVNAAAASLLATYLLTTSQSAGGFAVSFNIQGIKDRIVYLCNHSGNLFPVPAELQLNTRSVTVKKAWIH